MECLGGQNHEEEETLTQEDMKIAQLISSMFLLGFVSCVVGIISDWCPCSCLSVADFE